MKISFARVGFFILFSALVLALSACVANPAINAVEKPAEKSANQGDDPNYDKDGKLKSTPVKVRQTERGVQISSEERVLFDTGRSDIKGDGAIFVERVATILKTKTEANVLIEGHTDNVGGAALNQQLSTRRADAVKDALVKQGVALARIKSQGFGVTKPVADNASAVGRQANRRTDIIVLGETEANLTRPATVATGSTAASPSASPTASLDLADQLSSGLDKFLKNAGEFIKNVFGSKSE